MSAVATARALRAPRPQSPYVGLVPYGEADAAFFFGRSQEAGIVAANLRSARLTILYGPSGVGKSSLLMAGVVHALREEASSGEADAPFAVCVVRSWLEDPVRMLEEAARDALQELLGDAPLGAPHGTLAESLRAWTERAGTLLVVLDQFEEYFQYHAADREPDRLTGFAAELAAIVNDPDLAVNVLLSLREDAWAKLDRFEGHVPLLFANYVRVDHLDLEAAREAIEGPIAAWNDTLPSADAPYDVEPQLIVAVLAAAAGGSGLTTDGETAATDAAAGDRVEAPFLQLVLERLWRATVADDERMLTLARLEQLGGARRIVENHLLVALRRLTRREQDVASDCFRFLVSSNRTKIAHPATDLAEWTRRPEPEVVPVLDRLCSADSGRILRAVAPEADAAQGTSYELFHDVLAEPILVWRRAHEQERSRRAAHRRLLRVGGAALALVAVFAALSVWALIERGHADSLFHKVQAINFHLLSDNAALTKQRADKARENTKETRAAAAQKSRVEALRVRNRDLRNETAGLRTRRNDLDRQIASVRAENRQLAAAIGRFNSENQALAARINVLDDEFDRLARRLERLRFEHASLTKYARILVGTAATLRAELKALRRENVELERKARQLGYPLCCFGSTVQPQQDESAAERERTRAILFGIPDALSTAASLRRQIDALDRQLARLLERRARLTDEAGWLRNENRLLARQRDALRAQIEQLEATRATAEARRRRLQQTRARAEAEHERLTGLAATGQARNRVRRRTVEAHDRANATLQDRNNRIVARIGDTQVELAGARAERRKLVEFITPHLRRLLQAARDPALDSALASLLAVQAYQVAPYDPDDAAHPDVYNALWLALSRLDADAARELVAPVAKPVGKIGTTQSALIVQKLCGLVTRGLTSDEWKLFLPAGAPYTAATSQPCR